MVGTMNQWAGWADIGATEDTTPAPVASAAPSPVDASGSPHWFVDGQVIHGGDLAPGESCSFCGAGEA